MTEALAGNDDWQPVTARFAAHAARYPDRIAVETAGAALSYAELDARIGLLANRLAASLGDGDRVIGVCLERDVDLPAWLLAILRVGGAYLPLDPSLPPARLASVIEDAAPALIVASRRNAGSLPPTSVPILIAEEGTAPAHAAPAAAIRPDTLAYIIYTSGSTGRPKGVEIEHGSLAALMTTMASSPGFAAGQRMMGLTRISFDLSVPDMFLPFAVGGTLSLVDLDVAADPERLAAALAHFRPDLVQGTPSTWRALLEAGWAGLPGLRLLAGGEAMTRDLADRLLPRCAELWNIYGPTEATVWATTTRVCAGDGAVPIGWPMTGVAVWVLDENLRPVAPGEVGEIVIGGTGVARGYRNRADLTADRFVRLPGGERVYRTGDLGRIGEGGALFCLGRSDDQVKLRGFRVELGDVEAALAAHPDVAWCAARLWLDGAGHPILVAYLVPRPGTGPGAGAVKRALARLLPPYMVPDRIVAVPVMPLTPNGKVDRAALPSPFTAADSGSTPADESIAARLAAIWCELLGLATINADDDFFDLGGYSLMTVRLARRIQADFGVTLSLVDMMRCSRLDAMAQRIADGSGGAQPACMLLNAGGDRTPIFWVDAGPLMRTVMRELDADRPAYTLNLSPEEEAALDGDVVSLPAIAARLRDRLTAFCPTGVIHLGGWCRWGVVAFELARQLEGEGREIGLLTLLDAECPRAPRRRSGVASAPCCGGRASRSSRLASASVSRWRPPLIAPRPMAAKCCSCARARNRVTEGGGRCWAIAYGWRRPVAITSRWFAFRMPARWPWRSRTAWPSLSPTWRASGRWQRRSRQGTRDQPCAEPCSAPRARQVILPTFRGSLPFDARLMMNLQAVLFDVDGTLVDSNDFHVAAWEEAFASIGASVDRQRIHDQIGKGSDMLLPALFPDLDEAGRERLGDAHGAVFKAKYLDRVRAFPQAHDLLARVKADGRRVVLASSASQSELDRYLGLLDAHDLVSEQTTSDDVASTKPAPDIFATALAKTGSLPGQAIVVGDTPYDIEAARKAGIAAIGLRSGGFADAALTGAGAIALYDDAAHLLRNYDASPLAR